MCGYWCECEYEYGDGDGDECECADRAEGFQDVLEKERVRGWDLA